MRKTLLIGFAVAGTCVIILAAIVLMLMAAPAPSAGPVDDVEVEDCDAEDRAKREYWECGYIPAATKAPYRKQDTRPVVPVKPRR